MSDPHPTIRQVITCFEHPELEAFARQFCTDVLPGLEVQTRSVEEFIELLQQPHNPDEIMLLALSADADGRLHAGSEFIQQLMASPVPVLVIRQPQGRDMPATRLNRIVVPLDGSSVAGQAVPIASRVAQMNRLPVKFVMVIDPNRVIPPAYAYDPEAWGVIEELRTTAHWALTQAESMMENNGVPASSDLLLGSINASLMASIGEGDLVVMTTHGLNRHSLRYGDSVAMRVLATTQQPILIMQAETQKAVIVDCQRLCTCGEPLMNNHARIA